MKNRETTEENEKNWKASLLGQAHTGRRRRALLARANGRAIGAPPPRTPQSTALLVSYCSNFSQNFRDKKTQKKEIKRQMQIVAEIYQNRTAGKDRFFQNSSDAQID
jgi:hypothetical protein